MLAGFGPAPLLQAGAPWHSPPAPLQFAVLIDAVPDAYVLTGGGVGVVGSCVKPTGALASKRVSVTMVVNKKVPGLRQGHSDEGNFLIMRVN